MALITVELDNDLKNAAERVMNLAHISPDCCITHLYQYIAEKQQFPFTMPDCPAVFNRDKLHRHCTEKVHHILTLLKTTRNEFVDETPPSPTLYFRLAMSLNHTICFIYEHLERLDSVYRHPAEHRPLRDESPSTVIWTEILWDLKHAMDLIAMLSSMDSSDITRLDQLLKSAELKINSLFKMKYATE
ncbi:TPA: hypothetical protein JAN03_11745 [Citrobacter freundii]|nr:hypothetical protein [Citrobacter freundii]